MTDLEKYKLAWGHVVWMVRSYPEVMGSWEAWKARDVCKELADCIEKMEPK